MREASTTATAAARSTIPQTVNIFFIATRRSIGKNSYKFPTKFLQFCRKWGITVNKSQNCDKMGH